MKIKVNTTSFGVFAMLSIALSAFLLWSAFGNAERASASSTFYCGDQPMPNESPNMPGMCWCKPEDSCLPLDPPPTQWNPMCCYEIDPAGTCVELQWRYQCCGAGDPPVPIFWGVAWNCVHSGTAGMTYAVCIGEICVDMGG